MKNESTEKVLKKLLKRVEILRRHDPLWHSGPHLIGEISPEWETMCYKYDEALDDVEAVILTELAKCGKL